MTANIPRHSHAADGHGLDRGDVLSKRSGVRGLIFGKPLVYYARTNDVRTRNPKNRSVPYVPDLTKLVEKNRHRIGEGFSRRARPDDGAPRLEVAAGGGHNVLHDWAARFGQDDAGESVADILPQLTISGGDRDYQDPQRRGVAARAALSHTTPHHLRCAAAWFRRVR